MRSQQNKQNPSHDRRLNWRERRGDNERRNPYRVQQMQEDCRRGVPRRESDVSGVTNEVDVWWELEYPAT
jgi:hypothetical protein